MGKLVAEQLVLGEVQTNTWIAVNEQTKEAVLIDPASDAQRIRRRVSDLAVKPAAILLTHGHYDHIGAVEELRRLYSVPCCAGKEEQDVLEKPEWNLSVEWGQSLCIHADRLFDDGEWTEFAGFRIQVMYTPGHTKGSVSYILPDENVVFSGDTLFRNSIGRTDLPTGSMSALVRSARAMLAALPDDMVVYPGHDAATSIGYEKKYNPFL